MKNNSISRILALAKTSGRRKAMALLLGFATLALAVGGMSPTAVAQTKLDEKDSKPTCTLETLKGRYLFAHSGTILPPAFGVTEPTPGADVGYHIFNGDGTGTDTVTVRIGTKLFLENFVTPISYTVNADCTGTITTLIPGGPRFDIFVAPNGDAVAIIGVDPGNYTSSISQRVSPM